MDPGLRPPTSDGVGRRFLGILGSKRGSKTRVLGGLWAVQGAGGAPLYMVSRGFRSKKGCMTGVNHPPDRDFGV